MFRLPCRNLISCGKTLKCNRNNSDLSNGKVPEKIILYESKFYNKQNKELLKQVKIKLQDEVILMKDEIFALEEKLENYVRDINENLRYLKEIEQCLENLKTKGS